MNPGLVTAVSGKNPEGVMIYVPDHTSHGHVRGQGTDVAVPADRNLQAPAPPPS
jgi:hypothetical protein